MIDQAIEEVTSRLGDAYTKHIPEARARREAIRGDYVTAGKLKLLFMLLNYFTNFPVYILKYGDTR